VFIGIRYDPGVVSSTFASFSQSGEDVVLWRTLHQVPNGRYVDVGANHPEIYSVSMGFYERGWSGITVEPDPDFAEMQRAERPRDRVVEAAITTKDGDRLTFHVVDGTGLSTVNGDLAHVHAEAGFDTHEIQVTTRTVDSILEEAGWEGLDIHFMSVDTEGSEKDVLESIDLTVWRPWVLVVEATAPLSTESTRQLWEEMVVKAGYRFCLFDGLSCYYVAEEHADALGATLSYPACPHDDYTTREYRQTMREIQELGERVQEIPELRVQITRWRAQAVTRWATAIASETELERAQVALQDLREAHQELLDLHHEFHLMAVGLQEQIAELRTSSSWRLTRPLRLLGRLARGGRPRR
jgi:FkbM family methyltransferase